MNILHETFSEAYCCSSPCHRDCACSIAVCIVGCTCIPNTSSRVPNSALFAVFNHASQSYNGSNKNCKSGVNNIIFFIIFLAKIGLIIERYINLKINRSI